MWSVHHKTSTIAVCAIQSVSSVNKKAGQRIMMESNSGSGADVADSRGQVEAMLLTAEQEFRPMVGLLAT